MLAVSRQRMCRRYVLYLNGVAMTVCIPVGDLPDDEHDGTHFLLNHRSQSTKNPGMHRGDMYKEIRDPCCLNETLHAPHVMLFRHSSIWWTFT